MKFVIDFEYMMVFLGPLKKLKKKIQNNFNSYQLQNDVFKHCLFLSMMNCDYRCVMFNNRNNRRSVNDRCSMNDWRGMHDSAVGYRYGVRYGNWMRYDGVCRNNWRDNPRVCNRNESKKYCL